MLAAVSPCAGECRFVRGILVGDAAGTRICGVFVGSCRPFAEGVERAAARDGRDGPDVTLAYV
jgi:hypothetical protein